MRPASIRHPLPLLGLRFCLCARSYVAAGLAASPRDPAAFDVVIASASAVALQRDSVTLGLAQLHRGTRQPSTLPLPLLWPLLLPLPCARFCSAGSRSLTARPGSLRRCCCRCFGLCSFRCLARGFVALGLAASPRDPAAFDVAVALAFALSVALRAIL